MPVSRRLVRRSLAIATLLTAAGAVRAGAQSGPPPVQPFTQSFAVNPLAIPFGLFSAEYEAALPTPGFTIGIGGSYFADNGDRDSWVEAKALYYPNETAFRGFSVGLSAGVHSARNVPGCGGLFGDNCGTERRSQSAPTLGVLASYDWLLGRAQRFRVGLGVGAKRVLKDVKSTDPLEQVYPDGRFVIGVVF
jgi:hypothetical protein